MTRWSRKGISIRSALLAAGASSGLLLATLPAHAAQFDVGPVSGSVDTTISLGLSYRTEPRADSMIGKANLNPALALVDVSQYPANMPPNGSALWRQWAYGPGSFGLNSDDGDLNYPNHHWISQILKVSQSLQMSYKNYGMFVRGYYFYDFVNTNFKNNPLTAQAAEGDTYRPASAEKRIGHRGQLLDAYLYGTWQPGGHYLNVRVGNQVVNWGESTFLAFGLNRNNPVDVSAIHQPGTKVKDILLPVPQVFASLQVTNSFSVAGYWQWAWRKSYLDPSGSYFSSGDPAGVGGNYITLGTAQYTSPIAVANGAITPRGPNDTNNNHNMYGLKLDYVFPNMTEVAFYAERNDMNVPILNYRASTLDLTAANPAGAYPTAMYYFSYPKGIDTLGASFNTLVGNMSLAGELSYTPDQPMQIDGTGEIYAALSPLAAPDPSLNPLYTSPAVGGYPYGFFNNFISGKSTAAPGSYVKGYRREHFWQLDLTGTYLFGTGNWFNANSVVVLGEVGADYVPNLPAQSKVRFATSGIYVKGGTTSQASGDVVANPTTVPNSDFANSFAYGYRLLIQPDYEAFLGSSWAFKPTLFWSQDVRGTTPGPMSNFVEGNKSASISADFSYHSQWDLSVGYNAFWGSNNAYRDRNYVSASVSYSF